MRTYNYTRDVVDERDHIQNIDVHKFLDVVKEVDLRSRFPPVFDQGNLGSCTANALAGLLEYEDTNVKFTPSRLFIYYNERDIEHTTSTDSGASLRDGMKSLKRYGACNESLWKYDISKFTVRPTHDCYVEALKHRVTKYMKLNQQLDQLKQSLLNGVPFVFGIVVYESFESDEATSTGMIPMPNVEKEKVLGSHAINSAGFSDEKQCFLFRNSWGPEWGDNGYGYIPYDYLLSTDLSSDFWVIEKSENNFASQNSRLFGSSKTLKGSRLFGSSEVHRGILNES